VIVEVQLAPMLIVEVALAGKITVRGTRTADLTNGSHMQTASSIALHATIVKVSKSDQCGLSIDKSA